MSNVAELTVHAKTLPKGAFVRFRPLEAGYDPEDWKALLEKHMRNTFTTLTKGQVLTIPSGRESYQFLIDKITPDGDGICIVDTDLEVDIEPLNEEQALESLKKQQAKAKKAEGSSAGGILSPGQDSAGHVASGAYVDYTVKDWDRGKSFEVTLQTEEPSKVDLFVNMFGPRQRAKPRIDEHLFEDISDRPSKRICIRPTNVELDGAESITISVWGYTAPDRTTENISEYTLSVRSIDALSPNTTEATEDTSPPEPGDVRCKNCDQWVPQARLFLHENFCLRNNVRCPNCKQVFQKSSEDWKNHWHCEHDEASGNSVASRFKHDHLSHQPAICTGCGQEFPDMLMLAHHRVTTCPGKEILCQFCHLLVPQKGPDDPEFTDPEVMLSGLTPHELADGARTTECHMCSKIVRLRDMATHLKHHDLERLSRPTPRLCRNVNCGRTMDGIGANGQVKKAKADQSEIGLCDSCFGPLYNSAYDPEHKALKRRVERRYLTQLVTGCGQSFCKNEFCKNGRFQVGLMEPGQTISSKDALLMTRPELNNLLNFGTSLHFCTDEASQKQRSLADMIAAETDDNVKGGGYNLAWAIAALEAGHGDLNKARTWLVNWAPTRGEERG